jgi:predicted DsbA family dithiol-disulfide isomerase
MTNFNITITSDIVCPWCYIGHTRISRAISNHLKSNPGDSFSLKYLPYYLNPPAQLKSNTIPPFPVKSQPRRDMYVAKFGQERAQQIERMMTQVSAGEGLSFKFGGMSGPSRNGHRLVHYAQNHGGEEAQNATMLGLWKRYFEREVDVTTLEVLTEVGVEAGLGTEQEIKEYLESGKDGIEVDELAEREREKGVTGVPHYEIQGMWEVSGAQESGVFENLFKRWKMMEAKKESAESGAVGKGDGCL